MSIDIIPTVSEKLAEFHDRSFVVLDNVIPPDQLDVLRDLTDRVIAYAQKRLVDPFAPYYAPHRPEHGVLYDLFQRHPEFNAAARNAEVLAFLDALLGPDILLYENSLVYKNAESSNAVPWHQDFINRPHEPKKIVVWFALDDVFPENGAMKVIPGSGKLGFLPWYKVEGETHHTRVKPEYVEEEKAVYAEVGAGSALIFDQLLLHSSEEVRSGSPRRAFRVSYQGFGEITAPRGCPVVVRGGSPEALEGRFDEPVSATQKVKQKKNAFRRAVNRVGRILSNY